MLATETHLAAKQEGVDQLVLKGENPRLQAELGIAEGLDRFACSFLAPKRSLAAKTAHPADQVTDGQLPPSGTRVDGAGRAH